MASGWTHCTGTRVTTRSADTVVPAILHRHPRAGGDDDMRKAGASTPAFRVSGMKPEPYFFSGTTLSVQSLSGRRYFIASPCTSCGVTRE